MPNLKELISNCAPMFVAACGRPYWVCVYDPPEASEPSMEFWVVAFDDWYPEEWPVAIIGVLPATSLARFEPEGGRRATRRGRRRRRGRSTQRRQRGNILCGVSEDGDAYAMFVPTVGPPICGTPTEGRLLDLLRTKLLLPPGPPSHLDLNFTTAPE